MRSAGRLVRVGSTGGDGRSPFWGIVQTCSKTSGFATVRRAEGTIGALDVTDDETEITVYIGIESFVRFGDEVFCVPSGSGITPDYCVVPYIKGLTWTEPDVADLAGTQDNGGGQCSTCCSDTVPAE